MSIHTTGDPVDHSNLKSRDRLYWVDVAKTAAIILVVLYHVGGAGVGHLFPDPDGVASEFWAKVNQVLLPMRMPLFFLAAGILARGAIERRWATVWRKRIIVLLWPYLLWSVAFACIAGFAYMPNDPAAYTFGRLVAIPFGSTGYWFLTVLILFFVAAKVFKRWPLSVLAISAALAITAPFFEPIINESMLYVMAYPTMKILLYAFWYFLGCYGVSVTERAASLNPWLTAGVGSLVFGVLTWAAWSGNLADPLSFALSSSGLFAAIGLSVLAARSARIRMWSEYIGGRTLPIYLMHPVLINLVVLVALLSGAHLGPNDTLATLLTPLLTVVCIVVSVVVYDRLKNTRMGWVYHLPDPTEQRIL